MQADTGSVRGGTAVVHGDDAQQVQRERPMLPAARQRFSPGPAYIEINAAAAAAPRAHISWLAGWLLAGWRRCLVQGDGFSDCEPPHRLSLPTRIQVLVHTRSEYTFVIAILFFRCYRMFSITDILQL